MRNTTAKLTFIILKFNITLINRMVIPKENALFKTTPKPKVNVQVRWISLFSKSSWNETTASGLSYELGVNCGKKVNGNWDIINKISKEQLQMQTTETSFCICL